MHKFTRGVSPVDLARTNQRDHDWNTFALTNEHAQLGDALYERQEHYCAYCETKITQKNKGHIEHLERRSDNPSRTFDWSNMFFSCNNPDSCGKYKDGGNPRLQFQASDIIDPSQEDPLDFFLYDMKGGISARDNTHRLKAEATIKIFNLAQTPRLKGIRADVARVVTSFLENNPLPTEDDITDFLTSLGNCNCISVYYSLLDRRMA